MNREHIEITQHLENLIKRLEIRKGKLNKRSRVFSFYRLFLFLSGIIISICVYFFIGTFFFWASAVLFITAFGIITKIHNKIIDSIYCHSIWLEIKKSHLARINLDWEQIPKAHSLFADPTFVETDLNIVGEQSLHHLINTSVTSGGSSILRKWLTNLNPEPDEILNRQLLVKELVPLSRFRDKMILNSSLVSKHDFNEENLMEWLKKDGSYKKLRTLLLILTILAPINLLLIILNFAGFISPVWMISSFAYVGLYLYNKKYFEHTLGDAILIYDELRKLYRIIRYLENYNYSKSALLKELCSPFLSKEKPSAQLDGINKIISFLRMRGNPLVWWILIALFPVDYVYAYKLENYKTLIAGKLSLWLQTWYKLEALNSLANAAYLNKDFSFPEFISSTNPADDISFDLKMIGHPLIPSERRVRNSFSMKKKGEIAIITGSNMSGKSTFLRTIGINLCLAYSGGPVNADSMEISLFRLFTCIKVSDSVIDGISYFYSEVKRLKYLLDELHDNDRRPVLFLIDEIFKGTNNYERLEGSKAYIKYMAANKGTGVISTHDLELVKIAEEIDLIKNYHFREDVVDGKMKFDYNIRQGPCPTTNALKIMKMEGLPIEI